jgi:DNA-binding transcriptional LysR family regulator
MKTKQIEAFKVVMECGSVTAAAGQLFVTQPAVTKHIAELERHVGFALFERTKGRFTPTAEAKVFYQNVRKTFDALDDLSDIAKDIKNLNRGHLLIGALPLLSTAWLPMQCAHFVKGKEIVNLTLRTPSSAKIQDWLISGQIDVGLCMIAGDARVNAEVLADLDAVCILPRAHRLAAKNVITPEDLHGEPFIMTGGIDGPSPQIEGLWKYASSSRQYWRQPPATL